MCLSPGDVKMNDVDLKLNGLSVQLGRAGFATLDRQVNGADHVEAPNGPSTANENLVPAAPQDTGLLGSTRIATPQGHALLSDLAAGDQVIDGAGNIATIQHALSAPRAKNALRMRAPYFGLDQDIILGCDHRLRFEGDIPEFLFGQDCVLVPAWALKDGMKVQHVELNRQDQLFVLQLDTGLSLKIGKCALASTLSAQTDGHVLDVNEARCFAAEFKNGFSN